MLGLQHFVTPTLANVTTQKRSYLHNSSLDVTFIFSAYPPTPLYVEAITEERANRCIARIDLLSKIREEIIVHPKFDERIDMCKSSYDLPEWWISGKHDRELLIGAAK